MQLATISSSLLPTSSTLASYRKLFSPSGIMAEKLEKLRQGVKHAEKGLVGAGCDGPPADC
jgi:hypothetical protein